MAWAVTRLPRPAAVAADADLAVGRVPEQIGKLLLGQWPVAECADFNVEVGADSGDLALGDLGVGAQRGY
jgi:hypothetical protein